MCYYIFIIDSDTLKREEEAIKLDGLNVAQLKEIREKVCKQTRTKTYTHMHMYTRIRTIHSLRFMAQWELGIIEWVNTN